MKNKEIPLVTIAIPFYNVAPFLERSLSSAFSQDYQNIEFLLIPDKSTDNSYEIAHEFCSKFTHLNIKILPLPDSNLGISKIRNIAIKEAKGDYLIFLDSDDILLPEAVKRLANSIIKNKADFTIGNYCHRTIDGELIKTSEFQPTVIIGKENIRKEQFNSQTSRRYHFASWAKIYSLDFLRKNNIYFNEKVILDDWVFSFLLYNKATKISVIKDNVYQYTCLRPGSIANTNYNKKDIKSQQSWIELFNFFSKELQEAIIEKNNTVIPFLLDRLMMIKLKGAYFGLTFKLKLNPIKIFNLLPKNKVNLYNFIKLL